MRRTPRSTALYTKLGRGFTRFQEAYNASLVRYLHGKFAVAADLVVLNDLRACLQCWRRKAAGQLVNAAWAMKALTYGLTAAFVRLRRMTAAMAARREQLYAADDHARIVHLRKLLARLTALGAPGGTWQLQSIASACLQAYRFRNGLARWQRYCFKVLCLTCAVQHARIFYMRRTLGGWMRLVAEVVAARAAQRTALQASVDLRLCGRVLTAWRDCVRLKLISMPMHLASLAGAWGGSQRLPHCPLVLLHCRPLSLALTSHTPSLCSLALCPRSWFDVLAVGGAA